MNKSKLIALRLTPREYEELKRMSAGCGVSKIVRTFITQGIQLTDVKNSGVQVSQAAHSAIKPQ